MNDADYRQRLEAHKQASTLQLLFKAARLVNEHALEQLRERHPDSPLRAAHVSLFPHIDLDGTRVTDIAARVGITKQAVVQLVNDLEALGMVERVPEPSDGRAKLVRFTEAGRQGLLDGLVLLRDVQAELTRQVGEERMQALHDGLVAVLEVMERPEAENA